MVTAADNITGLIGNTPLLKLNRVVPEGAADVYVKLEFFNPGGSVKDRIALAMIEDAEYKGVLKPGATIVEPTSGNTGIGLALVAAAKGYHLIITMPETMSVERRALMRGYGAELILTPGADGMPGAIKKAEALSKENGYFLPMQVQNPANPDVHERTTGVGRALRKINPDVKIYALEAAESPMLKEGHGGKHKIQGISAGFIPDVLDTNLYQDIIEVTSDQAIDMARHVSHEEGFLPGISAGANIFGAIEIAKKLGKGKTVATVAPDNGERYLSTDLFKFDD